MKGLLLILSAVLITAWIFIGLEILNKEDGNEPKGE